MYSIMYTFIFITIHINVYNIPTFNRKISTKRSRELSNIDDDDDIPLKDLVKQRSQSSSKYISQSSSKSIPPVKKTITPKTKRPIDVNPVDEIMQDFFAESSTSQTPTAAVSATKTVVSQELNFSQDRLDMVLQELFQILQYNPIMCATKIKEKQYRTRLKDKNPCLLLPSSTFASVFKIALYSIKLLFIHIPFGFKDDEFKENEYILKAAKQTMMHFCPTATKLNGVEISLIENMMTGTTSRPGGGDYFFFGHLRSDLPLKCRQQTQQFVEILTSDHSAPTVPWIETMMEHSSKLYDVLGSYDTTHVLAAHDHMCILICS